MKTSEMTADLRKMVAGHDEIAATVEGAAKEIATLVSKVGGLSLKLSERLDALQEQADTHGFVVGQLLARITLLESRPHPAPASGDCHDANNCQAMRVLEAVAAACGMDNAYTGPLVERISERMVDLHRLASAAPESGGVASEVERELRSLAHGLHVWPGVSNQLIALADRLAPPAKASEPHEPGPGTRRLCYPFSTETCDDPKCTCRDERAEAAGMPKPAPIPDAGKLADDGLRKRAEELVRAWSKTYPTIYFTTMEFEDLVVHLLAFARSATGSKVSDVNVAAVIDKHSTRAARGLAKYGVTTERGDLSTTEWLGHLQEELMDAAVYVQRLLAEFARLNPLAAGDNEINGKD